MLYKANSFLRFRGHPYLLFRVANGLGPELSHVVARSGSIYKGMICWIRPEPIKGITMRFWLQGLVEYRAWQVWIMVGLGVVWLFPKLTLCHPWLNFKLTGIGQIAKCSALIYNSLWHLGGSGRDMIATGSLLKCQLRREKVAVRDVPHSSLLRF